MAGTYIIWHNPKCSTSRFVLSALRDAGIQPLVRDYLKDPPDKSELRAALQAMAIDARRLLRGNEPLVTELGLNESTLDDEALIAALANHPVLINRPVVFTPNGTRLCRPKETIFELIAAD